MGIIVTGHTVPHADGDVALSFANFDERIVPMYQRLSYATHEFDVPLLAQLGHRGRRVSDASTFLGRVMKAPSAIALPDMSVAQHMPHAMTNAEIDEVIAQFANATRRVKRGGLDGVELAAPSRSATARAAGITTTPMWQALATCMSSRIRP